MPDGRFSRCCWLSHVGHSYGRGGFALVLRGSFVHRASDRELLELDVPPLSKLDERWEQIGIAPKTSKSCNAKRNLTVLGVDLIEDLALGPKASRVVDVIHAVADLAQRRLATVSEFRSLLGLYQWHDLLARPLLSCLRSAYAFSRLEVEGPVILWTSALQEILLNVALLPNWAVDLTRPWSPQVFATDASPDYGFGVSSARLDPLVVRLAAASAGRDACAMRLQRGGDEPVEKLRKGTEFRLPVYSAEFKTLISKRARRSDHSGALEAEAVILGLRRLFRGSKACRHRFLFLVDAQAVQGALQGGRSSAPTLRRCVARAAALMLAADARPRFAYLPSESNPADAPSRGAMQLVRSKRPRRDQLSRFDVAMVKRNRCTARLFGVVLSDSSRVCDRGSEQTL